MPTWGARLRVAIHVVGVVFEGHNDVGDRWVHGPSSMGIVCPTKRFFYSLFSVSNPPQPGIRVNIRWTCRRLAAICAALILPTFFFLRFSKAFLTPYLAALLMAADARALPAIKSRGMIPPRCFRRRVRRRGPQGMMTCLTEDTPLVFYTIFSHDGTIKRFPRIFFPFA